MAKRWSKLDPSRTKTERRAFMGEVKRRAKKLEKAVTQFMVEDDAFGMGERKSVLQNARQYAFLTSSEKVKQFQRWLQQQIDAGLLQVVGGMKYKPWTAQYVESAWRKGMMRAYTDVRKQDLSKTAQWYAGTKEQWLKSAFLQPEMMSKVELLAIRAFEGMKGVTASMSTQMSRILADGLANGRGPKVVARQMTEAIGSLTRSRYLTIARTEMIHAQAEGQLDGYSLLGIEQVNAEVEWSTAGDPLVCPICEEGLADGPYTLDEARGLIPAHPNCLISPDVPILTDHGWKRIEDVVVGDKVFTHKARFRAVNSAIRIEGQKPKVARIVVNVPGIGHRALTVTEDHPLRTACGWISPKDISMMTCVNLNYWDSEHAPARFIWPQLFSGYRCWQTRKPVTLYNLSVEEDESYIAAGFVVHNCRCAWKPFIEKNDKE